MRRALAVPLIVVVLATLVPQAQAAINKPQPFDADFPFMPGFGDQAQMTVVSGEASVTTTATAAAYGFFGTQGLTISGLDSECHGAACNVVTSMTVAPGGSVALCFPSPSSGQLEAGHALALFVDLAQDDDLNSFQVDKSLVAPAVDGMFTFTAVNRIQGSGAMTQPCTQHGGLAALDDVTRITLRNGDAETQTVTGKSALIAFSGRPTITPIAAESYIIPFAGSGSVAQFSRASATDAKEGLDLARVQEMVDQLDSAGAGATGQKQAAQANDPQDFLAGFLNGALLRLPGGVSQNESVDLEGSTFVRFSRLEVTGAGDGLAWEGKAYLQIEDGKVVGGKPLLGFWILQMPWWSYLLWAAAITLVVVRMVRKPPKDNPRWDQLKWVGWIATPVAWVLVFVLWDFEMRAVLGASLLSGPGGQFRLVVGLLQVGILGLIGFAVAAPLRLIGRNSLLLAAQGTFMGLSGSVAAILGFLFGAPYLRAYLGLILGQVMDKLA